MTGPIVTTTCGPIEGVDLGGCERYAGIAFAAAPVGALRFRPPAPVTAWTAVADATTFGPRAPQLPGAMEVAINGGEPPPTSEADCLTLNVWTPAADTVHRPVMVWIHGGGFVNGAGSSPWYDGERFCVDHDVVLVSVNYRLGVLGFTSLGAVGGDEFASSGNVGVLDVVAGLRWVATNIARFGGDPDNVTIFGESAGAMSVGTLLALPSAEGLFHRAILQSGAASHVHSREVAEGYTTKLCEALGMPNATVAQLQALPVDDLLRAHAEISVPGGGGGLVSSPVVDGVVLPRRPLEAVASGAARDVTLLIGTNRDEWRLFAVANRAFMETDDDRLLSGVERVLGDRAPQAIATYRERLADAPPAAILAAAMTDSVFRVPALSLADAQVAAGGDAYVYLFTWESPAGRGFLGSCHALELPFVFHTLTKPGASQFTGVDAPTGLADDLNATWAAFARHGDPARGSVGAWPLYDSHRRPTMILDVDCRLEDDPLGNERRLWMRS